MPSKKKGHTKTISGDYQFEINSKILAHHNLCIYEAKILDRRIGENGEAQYQIHYKGWNKRWDEWVDSRRLLPVNPSNLAIMKEKQAQLKKQDTKNNNNHSIQISANHENKIKINNNNKRKLRNTSPSSPKKKRKLITNNPSKKKGIDTDDDDDDDNDDEVNEQNVDNGDGAADDNNFLVIKLPTLLKRKLIRDWENITKKCLLIGLPRRHGERVIDVLNDYQEYAISHGHRKNVVTEICRGICDYFNQALEVTLLYKFERNKHENITKSHSHLSMDQMYGVEHLCRLFVKLPQLLAPNDLDNETRKILKSQIDYIIQFIIQNEKKYFEKHYITTT